MTPDEIQAIRERLLRATPGPWKAGAGVTLSHVTLAGDIWTEVADGIESEADADLIAHAPTDLSDLIAEVEKLRAQVERVREAIDTEAPTFWECEQEFGYDHAMDAARRALEGGDDAE